MPGHLVHSEETQRKILESDIFHTLESEGATEIAALYKVSSSKFVLALGSRTAKEKLQGTEIQFRLGDSETCLNFRKRVGPLRNGREPIFVTILLPEFISDQAVRPAFSNLGDVVTVFKGRHEFNRKIRNGKKYVTIFPAGEDPAILPRKISFHGRIKKGCSFRGKGGVVLQVQNSAHAWQELPCGYTHHRRFWHVFEWAEWYSWGEFCSCATRVFWWDSAFSRVSADVFCFFFPSFFCKNFT